MTELRRLAMARCLQISSDACVVFDALEAEHITMETAQGTDSAGKGVIGSAYHHGDAHSHGGSRMIGEPIPVLTLWQPWASLVAFGVKPIETRSWSTSYRGPLAIHAAARNVAYGPIGDYYCETWFSNVEHVVDRCYCDEGEVGPPCDRGATRTPCLTRPGTIPVLLPLGAIVSTCTLVDVVPIVERDADAPPVVPDRFVATFAKPARPPALTLVTRGQMPVWTDVENQRPYGDFTPGRYAWLLDDIVPVDPPVPFKGGQGLTKRWEPALT